MAALLGRQLPAATSPRTALGRPLGCCRLATEAAAQRARCGSSHSSRGVAAGAPSARRTHSLPRQLSLPAPALAHAAQCFKCDKENCLKCTSKSQDLVTKKWNITVTAIGCKTGTVSWICCRDQGCQLEVGDCTTATDIILNAGSYSTSEEKCNNVVNATFSNINEDAEYVTVQMHDGVWRGAFSWVPCHTWSPLPIQGSSPATCAATHDCRSPLPSMPLCVLLASPLAHPPLTVHPHTPTQTPGNQIGNKTCTDATCCSGRGGAACAGQEGWKSTVCEKEIYLESCPPCDPETDPECQVRCGGAAG